MEGKVTIYNNIQNCSLYPNLQVVVIAGFMLYSCTANIFGIGVLNMLVGKWPYSGKTSVEGYSRFYTIDGVH